jgi:hypothetical protein
MVKGDLALRCGSPKSIRAASVRARPIGFTGMRLAYGIGRAPTLASIVEAKVLRSTWLGTYLMSRRGPDRNIDHLDIDYLKSHEKESLRTFLMVISAPFACGLQQRWLALLQ